MLVKDALSEPGLGQYVANIITSFVRYHCPFECFTKIEGPDGFIQFNLCEFILTRPFGEKFAID
ncbi:hypothetical protein AQ875_21410 [Burkholderia pseudomallei]|nr:hypothetical protein AQ875_21410 [Burkholderia pseudomallei]